MEGRQTCSQFSSPCFPQNLLDFDLENLSGVQGWTDARIDLRSHFAPPRGRLLYRPVLSLYSILGSPGFSCSCLAMAGYNSALVLSLDARSSSCIHADRKLTVYILGGVRRLCGVAFTRLGRGSIRMRH